MQASKKANCFQLKDGPYGLEQRFVFELQGVEQKQPLGQFVETFQLAAVPPRGSSLLTGPGRQPADHQGRSEKCSQSSHIHPAGHPKRKQRLHEEKIQAADRQDRHHDCRQGPTIQAVQHHRYQEDEAGRGRIKV